jgi:hypothetical protein
MGLVEKWNDFARKKIFINDHVEMTMGRLVFTAIITAFEAAGIIIMTGNWGAIFPLFSNMLFSLKKQRDKDE